MRNFNENHLISLMYVVAGASFNPIHSPNKKKPKQMSEKDSANPNKIQATPIGMLINIIVCRRPIL